MKITLYYYYFVFIVVGLISKSLSVCYDKWLITDKLCNQYKLLYFKLLLYKNIIINFYSI